MVSSFDKSIKKILEESGCYFVRTGKGSHEIWCSPISQINFAVSRHIKSRHTANGILKAAGIDKRV